MASMNKTLKTAIFTFFTILFTILLLITVFSLSGKVKEEKQKAVDAGNAAAAYASALAESNEKIDVVNQALSESRQEAADTVRETPDYSSEATLYSDFTAGDAAIRAALNALSEDDPALVKNFRIRVDLSSMEKVTLSGAEGKRVRFTGNFGSMKQRENAVIRINTGSGSFKGKLHISGLKFNDNITPDLSSLTGENLENSHGSALRSAEISSVNGEKCISCETDFSDTKENDGVSVVIPLNDLDSSTFSKVYYDLWFEGDTSSFSFTTGCDFTGRKNNALILDDINKAFILYRGQAALGDDAASARDDLNNAVSEMKALLSLYPETDPLVIKVCSLLDEKMKIADMAGVDAVSPEGETNDENKDASLQTTSKDTGNTGSAGTFGSSLPVYTASSNDSEGSGILIPLALLFSFLAVLSAVILAFTKNSGDDTENDVETNRYESSARRGNNEPVGDLDKEYAKKTASIQDSLDRLETALSKPAAVNSSELILLTEKADNALRSLGSSLSELADNNNKKASLAADDARRAMASASDGLTALSDINDTLSQYISEAASQLEETSRSVKDINQAATIISDVASETNLLSLNASIEAARAGEAGRGFAVVAGEVQRLADQTEKSASEISATVEKLNSDFRKTHALMEKISSGAVSQNEGLRGTLDKFSAAGEAFDNSKASGDRYFDPGQCLDIVDEISLLLRDLRDCSDRLVSSEDTSGNLEQQNIIREIRGLL